MPSWQERADYVVNGILKKSLEAVAHLHENGIVHRSIGRSSIILSSVGMDKSETASLEAKSIDRLVIKLADFGFSSTIAAAAAKTGSFGGNAQSRYTGSLRLGSTYSSTSSNPFFSVAEDLHALGLVFLGVLLTSLADFSDWKVTNKLSMPQADEDRIQRVRIPL
jgi:serine/threonine protein kinase